MQVVFYTIILTIIMFVLFPDSIKIGNIINTIMPITRNSYWYLSSYFGLYLVMPLLQCAVKKMGRDEMKKIIFLIICIMTILPTFLLSNPYSLNSGYSAIWLCILFVIGAYIRKYDVGRNYTSRKLFFIYLLMSFIALFTKIVLEFITIKLFNEVRYSDILISYVSPTIIICSISFFLLFKNLSINEKLTKIIKILSPATLGVYIIHLHPLIWNYYLQDIAINFVNNNAVIMVILIISLALLIYLVCSMLDIVRKKVFNIFHINKVCFFLEEKVFIYINKILNYFE